MVMHSDLQIPRRVTKSISSFLWSWLMTEQGEMGSMMALGIGVSPGIGIGSGDGVHEEGT